MKELNLIPYELRQRSVKELKIRNYIAGAVIIACLLFVCLYVPQLRLNALQSEEQKLNDELQQSISIIDESKRLTTEIANYRKYTDKVDFLTKQKIIVSDKIKELQAFMPKDATLDNINYSKGALTINGFCKNYNSSAEFVANLQMSKKYSGARLANVTANQARGGYIFSVNITY